MVHTSHMHADPIILMMKLYLVIVDAHSDFHEITKMYSTTSFATTCTFKETFSH